MVEIRRSTDAPEMNDDRRMWLMDPLRRAFGGPMPFESTEAAERCAKVHPEELYEMVEEYPTLGAKIERPDGRVELHPPVLNALGSSALRSDLAPVRDYRGGDEDESDQ